MISARQEVKNAYMYVEVCEVMEDILYALSVSIGGTYECEMCMYENKRDMVELKQAVGNEKFGHDRPLGLQLKGAHLMKSVSIGGCGHASMPWQVEERKKRTE